MNSFALFFCCFLFFFRERLRIRCSFLVCLGVALHNIDFCCSDITCKCKWSFFLCSHSFWNPTVTSASCPNFPSVVSFSFFFSFFCEDSFYLVHSLLSSQLTAVAWQQSTPFVSLTYLPWSYPYFSWGLVKVCLFSTYLRFFCCVALHFIFKGSLPPELTACVLHASTLDVRSLNPFLGEEQRLADKNS